MDWIFWLILVIILSILEAVTVNLVSIWFVISGIITMILSFIITDTAVLSSIFVILGILFLIITRPIVAKLRNISNDKTNLDRIIGMEGVVTLDITKNSVGEVKVDGKRWSAVCKKKCLKGDTVVVEAIDGVKLIVKKESD